MPGEATFELRGVSKRFGADVALRPTNLVVRPAATTVLIGPSGSGKSTLLRLMNGLLAPDTGEVLFRGERVDAKSAPGLRRRMGYMVQGGGLFPHLTCAQNVALMARHLRWVPQRIHERIEALRALMQLSGETLARFP